MKDDGPQATRRGFLGKTAGLVAVAGLATNAEAREQPGEARAEAGSSREPFYGPYQGGILTPQQSHSYFAAFDLITNKRDDLIALLGDWTDASARMTQGLPIAPFDPPAPSGPANAYGQTANAADDPPAPATPAIDTGETDGLTTARLTLTFGFGPGVFGKDGKDRYGLADRRPEAFVDLPHFVGDELVEAHTGGDLSVQACADDPQVAFHAVRQLARLADGTAQIRWTQTGFMPRFGAGQTPRNIMGFKDGTNNPAIRDAGAMDKVVWVGGEGPAWMRGGSYLVARRIRIALEHWDRMNLGFQEQTVGRHKASGAPVGLNHEFAPLDLDAKDKDGNYVIAENAHVRLAAAASNGGAQILRRPYSYNDGVNFTAERWPPWRQGMEYDAGLFFLSYQRDPRTGFIRIFENMAKLDMMNQFATHVGGGHFACPAGIRQNEFLGQRLFA